VKKGLTKGEKSISYYYVILSDYDTHTKVFRWLCLKNKALFFDDLTTVNESFEQIFITCIGKDNCEPNVYVLNNKMLWTCGENPSCSKEGVIGCNSSRTVIFE
jgi:hypothetical protein